MTNPVSIRSQPSGAIPDKRAGLGYGQLEPRHHVPRQDNSSFPYEDPDEHEDVDISDIDPETQAKLRKVINGYLANDFLDVKGTDPFYYAAGNTRLGEAVGTSIAPFPAMYRKRIQVGGGANKPAAIRPGSLQQTGSKIGFSHGHKDIAGDDDINVLQLDSEVELDELPLKKVRLLVRKILEKEK